MNSAFDLEVVRDAQAVEAALLNLLKNRDYPPRLLQAMQHAISGSAKRLRPFILMESARLFNVVNTASFPAALSLECVHCYSLVHDDLPSMDNDKLRRGLPTVHIAYDEATAILAGDALLTLAFEILGGAQDIAAETRLTLISELGGASAVMVGGQMLDLAAEGRFEPQKKPLHLDEKDIFDLQSRKTGALIRYAMRAGALLGGASESELLQLTHYGETLGLLYQIADDLLDATGSVDIAGKAVAKDLKAGKATFVALAGVDGARKLLAQLVEQAQDEISGFAKAARLKALPAYLAARVS